MKDNDSAIWISKVDSFTIKRFIMTDNYNPQELYKKKKISSWLLYNNKKKIIQDMLWSSVFLYWHFNKCKILTLPSSRYSIKDTRPGLEKFSGSNTCTTISKNL